MSKKFLILEKTVSVLIVLIGLILFAFIVSLPTVSIFSGELHIQKIIAIFAISGGVLLFFQKKAGWILSTSILFSTLIYYGFQLKQLPDIDEEIYATLLIFYVAILLILFSLGILLLNKPFTTKYSANLPSVLIILGIVSYFIVDRFISYELVPQMEQIAINCEDKANILQTIYDSDQGMRKGGKIIPNVDRRNLTTVISLIEKCGMPNLNEVSENQMNAVWLVFQHGDNKNRKKYFSQLKKAAENGDLKRTHIAMMEDRILIHDGLPQIYGSQINSLTNLKDPETVNKRRAEIGFEPLEDYASRFGVEFNIPQVD